VRGVIQPDPARQADVSCPENGSDRSETCSLVMMLDAWLCAVLGLTPKHLATPALSRPRKVPAAYILRPGLGARWVCSAHRYVPSATTGISKVSSNSVPWKKSNCSRRIEAAGKLAAIPGEPQTMAAGQPGEVVIVVEVPSRS
jgi:hypothetical protein